MSSNRYVQGEPGGLKSRLIAKAKFRAVTAVPSLNRNPRLTVIVNVLPSADTRNSAAAAGRSRAFLDDGERIERQLGHAQNAERAPAGPPREAEVDEAQCPAARSDASLERAGERRSHDHAGPRNQQGRQQAGDRPSTPRDEE